MSEQTWTFHDRSRWGSGLWDTEPDKVQWTDADTKLPCLAVRNNMGAWCGYVGVAKGHPLFEVGYSECPQQCGERWCNHTPESTLDIHGGITYSDACQEGSKPYGICHIPEPGQPEHVWWFGFDTSHAGDLVPAFTQYGGAFISDDAYRTMAYIQAECKRLAAQLVALDNPVQP